MRAPPGFGHFYAELARATVAFHPRLVKVTGSVTATIFLDQLLYWTPRTSESAEGWVYKTQAEIQDETGLTRFEQETARRKLRERGILKEKRAGVPARLFFRVDLEMLSRLWEEAYPLQDTQDAEIQQSSKRGSTMLQPSNQERAKSPFNKQGSAHSFKETKTTNKETTNNRDSVGVGGLTSQELNNREPELRQALKDRSFSDEVINAVLNEIRLTSADREITYPLRYAVKTAKRIQAESDAAQAQLTAGERGHWERAEPIRPDPEIERAIADLPEAEREELRLQAQEGLAPIARTIEPAIQAAMRDLYRKRYLEGVA